MNEIINTITIYSIQNEFENVCFGWEEQRAEEGSARQRATNQERERIHYLINEVKSFIDDAIWHYENRLSGHIPKNYEHDRRLKNDCVTAVKNLIEKINKLG